MNNFTYYAPTKVVFGKDTESKVAELIKEFGGSRVLVHYGGQSALKSGLISKVKKSLKGKRYRFLSGGWRRFRDRFDKSDSISDG